MNCFSRLPLTIQTVTNQLLHSLTPSNVSLSVSQLIDLHAGVSPKPSFHPPLGTDQVPLTLSPAPASFLHPAKFCMKLYFPFSDGQGLLPALSGFSVRSSASEDIFLTSLWREMYSVSPTFLCHLVSPQKEKFKKQFSSVFFFPSKEKTC